VDARRIRRRTAGVSAAWPR